jgi:hypothetical protein
LAGFISAGAFATILAVVFGLLIVGASSAANDLVVGLSGRQLDERKRLRISRVAAMALGALGILLGLACEGQNVAYLLACHSNRSRRQLSMAAPGNLLGRLDHTGCGRWLHVRPYLIGWIDGNGANYLVKGTGSWPCDLSIRLAGIVHGAPHAVGLLAGIDRGS